MTAESDGTTTAGSDEADRRRTPAADGGQRDRTVLPEWPVDRTVYLTLDLEADYAGLLSGSYEAARRVDALVDVLARHDVPLTCFLQTELLEAAPEAIERLESAPVPVEFHAHSHTHAQRDGADVPTEVGRSVRAVRERFGTDPLGYRFPEGIMRPGDYEILAAAGVDFDASLFPAWRPDVASINGYDNAAEPTRPFVDRESGIVELPFTVYGERLRVPVALSYLKLLGRPYRRLVRHRPPRAIVFDMHMHDLVTPSAYRALPPAYRAIYGRNRDDGVEIFESFVSSLAERGYEFGRMSELYGATRAALRAADGAGDGGDADATDAAGDAATSRPTARSRTTAADGGAEDGE